MRKLFYSLLILIWFWPACTTQKKVNRQKVKEKTEQTTKTKSESSTTASTTIDSRTVAITTTTETADTILRIPGSSMFGVKLFTEIMSGNSLVIESDQQKVEVFWDSLQKTIKATAIDKPREIPVNFIRTTEKKELTNTQTKKEEQIVTDQETTAVLSKETESDTMNKEVTRSYMPLYITIAIALIIVITLIIWGRKIFSLFRP